MGALKHPNKDSLEEVVLVVQHGVSHFGVSVKVSQSKHASFYVTYFKNHYMLYKHYTICMILNKGPSSGIFRRTRVEEEEVHPAHFVWAVVESLYWALLTELIL